MVGTMRGWLLLAAPSLALALALVTATLAPPPARASDARSDSIHLDYRAPAFCPGVDEFVAQVRRALPRLRLAPADEPAPLFTVTLDGGATGRVTIASNGAMTGSRDVRGASCEEVANVLAFAVALAVDPRAIRPAPLPSPASPIPTATPPASPPALANPPGESTRAEARAAESTPAAAASTRALPALEEPPAPGRGENAPAITQTWWALSAHALVAGGLAPNPTLGGGPSADLGGRIRRLRPSIRVGLEYSTSAPAVAGDARVAFANAILSIEGCPTAVDLGDLTLLPCVRVDGGARFATGENIAHDHGTVRPWFDVGPMAHLRIRVVRSVFLDLGGGVLFAAVQDRVFLDGSPPVTVDRVPAFGGRGEIALGVEFR
jgi:hypothetical protein